MGQAIQEIRDELVERLDVDAWRLSTAAPARKKDGLPYADANPEDPGAVVRWTKDEDQYAVPCDKYDSLRDNIRAIGLYLEEKRKMEARPVKTLEEEFATARLPPGDESPSEPGPAMTEEEAAELLGIQPGASERLVKTAFQEKAPDAHPDQGGSKRKLERLRAARETLL